MNAVSATDGGITGAFLTVHTPRFCTHDAAILNRIAHPDFQGVRDGLVEQGRVVDDLAPDVLVVNSSHLISTFPVVVDGTPRHRGVLTAQEAPQLIKGVAYDFPGDLEFAAAIVGHGERAEEHCILANDIHYPLDYGTVMPVVLYLDRKSRIPVVPVSMCLASDLQESHRWGGYIARAARETGRRAAFVASCSLSHRLVRKPEQWPAAADQEIDHRIANLLASGRFSALWEELPAIVRTTTLEADGRHLAMLLGALMESQRTFATTLHAYGPSSGSGNYVISMRAV